MHRSKQFRVKRVYILKYSSQNAWNKWKVVSIIRFIYKNSLAVKMQYQMNSKILQILCGFSIYEALEFDSSWTSSILETRFPMNLIVDDKSRNEIRWYFLRWTPYWQGNHKVCHAQKWPFCIGNSDTARSLSSVAGLVVPLWARL